VSDDAPAGRAEGAARTGARDWVSVYLKGVAMGTADTIPGVSGGTIALITGIYERLIEAVAGIDAGLVAALGGVHRRSGRARFVGTLRERDVPFLVVLGLGAVTAVVVLSRVVHAALVDYRAGTFAFFFGLIAASAVVLYRELTLETPGSAGAALLGFAIAFLLAGASSGEVVAHSLPVVFVTAAIAITAMILPGVSGSFLLLLLGQYEFLTGVLTRFVDDVIEVVRGGGTEGLLEGGAVVAVFGVGALVGLLSVAKAIRWALRRYRRATLAFLVSLMVGSLRLPVLETFGAVEAWSAITAVGVLTAATVGAVAVLALDHYTSDLELSTDR